MSIYLHEIRAHWKGLLGWSAAMAFTVVSGMVKFQGYSATPGQSNISELLDAFPKSLQVIFGMNGLDLTKLSGYFGVMYLYIVLVAAVYAALMGAEIISKEERDHTSEFLYPKPVSRSKVLTEKLLAALTLQSLFFVVTVVSSVWVVGYYNKGESLNTLVLTLMGGVALFQLVSFAFGAFFAGFFTNPKLATPAVTTVVVGSYILQVFVDVSGKIDFLAPLTPFKYLSAQKIINEGRLDAPYVFLLVGVSLLLLVLTYYFYNHRDLEV